MPQDRFADPTRLQEDIDYVGCFDALATVETEIRRRGPSPHLLLRRSMLSMALGNHVAALDAARDAVAAAPREAEAHYQEGLAWLCIARVQIGAATTTGRMMTTRRPLRTLLENASESMAACLECSPGDGEAAAVSQWLDDVLAHDDGALQGLLEDQV